jgi:hypothetical protein
MKEAEHTIRRTVHAREKAIKDLADAYSRIEQLEYEAQHLKGLLLTYKVACFSHGVDVPKLWAEAGGTTDAYGAEVLSYSKCKTTPHALEVYLDKNCHIVADTSQEEQTQVYKPIPGAFPIADMDPENMQLTLSANFPIPLPLTATHLETLLNCNIFPNLVQQLNAGDLKFFTNPSIETTSPTGAAREASVAKEEPVDDDAEMWRLRQESEEGYKCLPPMTPVDALRIMRQERHDTGKPAVLFQPSKLAKPRKSERIGDGGMPSKVKRSMTNRHIGNNRICNTRATKKAPDGWMHAYVEYLSACSPLRIFNRLPSILKRYPI